MMGKSSRRTGVQGRRATIESPSTSVTGERHLGVFPVDIALTGTLAALQPSRGIILFKQGGTAGYCPVPEGIWYTVWGLFYFFTAIYLNRNRFLSFRGVLQTVIQGYSAALIFSWGHSCPLTSERNTGTSAGVSPDLRQDGGISDERRPPSDKMKFL